MYAATLDSALMPDSFRSVYGYADEIARFTAQQQKVLAPLRQFMLDAKRRNEQLQKEIKLCLLSAEQQLLASEMIQAQADMRRRIESVRAINKSLSMQAQGLSMAADRIPENHGFLGVNSLYSEIREFSKFEGWQKPVVESIEKWKDPIDTILVSYLRHIKELEAHFKIMQSPSHIFSSMAYTRITDRSILWADQLCRDMNIEIERLRWPLRSSPLQHAYEWKQQRHFSKQSNRHILTLPKPGAPVEPDLVIEVAPDNVVQIKKPAPQLPVQAVLPANDVEPDESISLNLLVRHIMESTWQWFDQGSDWYDLWTPKHKAFCTFLQSMLSSLSNFCAVVTFCIACLAALYRMLLNSQ